MTPEFVGGNKLQLLMNGSEYFPALQQAFDAAQALDKLEGFASFHGADFYGLPRNQGQITLRRESWTPPESFAFGQAQLKPLRSGEALPWRLT